MSEEMGVNIKRSKDFSKWYLEIVRKGGFVDQRSPVKGFDVILPWGYAVWEIIQKTFDAEIKKKKVRNAYFPLMIPESLIRKEEEHFAGFKAEAMAVTEAGEEKLEEKLYVRPTSETIMYNLYALWIRSHRDLPLLINQWNNVVRHDTKQTRPFVRPREFLWQEGHTCHAEKKGSDDWIKTVVRMYDKIYDILAMDRLVVVRPKHDTFPGADYSVAFDTLAQSGKVIQGPGTHNLGQNFSKPFGIKYLDEKGEEKFVWQTSWGMSTRQLGVLIMHHADDNGAIIPPAVAPIQAVIIPIPIKGKERVVKDMCKDVEERLEREGVRCETDSRDYSPGYKFNEWELRGVPVRIEIGPIEAEERKLTVVKRNGRKKAEINLENTKDVVELLDRIQREMRKKSETALKESIKDIKNVKKLAGHKGIARIEWCSSEKCAEHIKADSSGFEIRGTLYGKKEKPKGKCIHCKKPAKLVVYAAKAY